MGKLLFCSEPYHGHVDPVLYLVRELVERGTEVIFYTTEQFKEDVQATGAIFRAIPDIRDSQSDFMEVPLVRKSYDILQEIVDTARQEHPDCLIYDSMCLWGMLLARILNVTAARVHVHFPINALFHPFNPYSPLNQVKEKYPEFSRDMQKICDKYFLPSFSYPEMLYQAEPLNIVRFLGDFFPAREMFDERFQFVGHFFNAHQKAADFSFDRGLYISLGTIINKPKEPFYDICLSAFGNQPQPVVISTGGHELDYEVFGPLPKNVIMRPYVPQVDILSRTDVFITHGGMNSTMEALYYGVPMVVVPFSLEQAITARRIEELHLGVVVKNVTAHTLRQAVAQVRNDQEIRFAVQQMQNKAQQSGGYTLAADLVLRLIG